MKKPLQLSAEERAFFYHVYKAGLASPFSDDRIALEGKIAGASKAPKSKRIERAIRQVKTHIDSLERSGPIDFNRYGGEDRHLVRAGLLFDFFYDFRVQFDQLIQDQIAAGDTPLKVSFADDALERLQRRGFTHEDALRYFALSYQLRRAYFFLYRTLVGRSPCMKKLRQDLWHNVFTHNIELYDRYLWNQMEDFSTLLLGETGTGKGTAAMAIGRSGFIPFNPDGNVFVESFTRSFVSLNLSQFPDTLVESELFGHKKGAFTGAVKDHRGVFDHCSPFGAILLDEIGELSIPIQIKLLQVLQDRKFAPVGSHQEGRFEGRVIAATNRSLKEIHTRKIFRDDFYYRLCSDIITVPPLRQRIREDAGEMDDLLGFTVKRMVGRASPELVTMVREVIDSRLGADYSWPGNVRELEQCVRRVILKREYVGRQTDTSSQSVPQLLNAGIENGSIDAHRLVTGYCFHLYERFGTYEEVARRTGLDRRTVKKYVQEWAARIAVGESLA
ncbi:MAG: sigma 54-interacting transcriptional regulator [Desulfobacterales bacterium]|nr:sigma 54-interacting transcriptional regulator [Desulfobacterales bacterium]MDJ0873765.1 sigma 54-interacting transcriptional regulator [Desulfobacterales bacterium]